MSVLQIIDKLLLGNKLNQKESVSLFNQLLSGKCAAGDVKSVLSLLQKRSETSAELTGLVRAARQISKPITHPFPKSHLTDGCGTGGDHKGTINISTIACLVAASAGARIAKHGNRSITSKCGSSDLISALGINIEMNRDQLFSCLRFMRFTYFHAPYFTQAFRLVQPIRKSLALNRLKSIFNLTGPLLNPMQVRNQVIGVFHVRFIPIILSALKNMGAKHVLVLCGADGTDEITTHQTTRVGELRNNAICYYTLQPRHFNLRRTKPAELRGGKASDNAKVAEKILNGTDQTTRHDAVVANAGALLYVSGVSKNIKQGIIHAQQAINSGRAGNMLRGLRVLSHAT